MKALGLVIGALAALTGLVAAWYWYKASKVNVVPFEEIDGELVPVPISDVGYWVEALRDTVQKSGGLNKTAAVWTALSVGLSGVAAFVSAFAS